MTDYSDTRSMQYVSRWSTKMSQDIGHVPTREAGAGDARHVSHVPRLNDPRNIPSTQIAGMLFWYIMINLSFFWRNLRRESF
jgi:hypothetical protein